MKLSEMGMDQYDRRARFQPALLLLLPMTLTAFGLTPDAYKVWTAIIAVVAQAGGSYLLAQVVGDAGKRREGELFSQWGGRPTDVMLSHAKATNRVLLAERHAKLAKLLISTAIPTAEVEQADPKRAAEIYTAACDKLRGVVRAQKDKYDDVQRENIGYGFRRNLWANRTTGIIIAVLSLIPVGTVVAGNVSGHQQVDVALVAILVIELLLLAFWSLAATPAWVKRAADLYAERLLEALDSVAF